jgi:hypothetical protein
VFSWLGNSYPYRHTVLVTLKTGTTFRGILWNRCSGWLILRHAELLKDKATAMVLPGEVLVDRRDIEFVQVPPGVPEP